MLKGIVLLNLKGIFKKESEKMKKFIVLFCLIPQFVFGQFGSGVTVKKIDKIQNESGTDIVLDPNDKVDIEYFTGSKAVQSTADGELEESSITNAELGNLTGSTENIQTSLDEKALHATEMNVTAPITGGGDLSANRTFGITQSNTSTDGYLSATDWNTFNDKQSEITGVDGDLYFYNSGLANLNIGTQDQVLTVSALGFPIWADPAISTTLDTKGQIQGFSTTNANIGPCLDDQIIVYDDAEATGWKCSTVPATSPTTTIGDLVVNTLGTPSGDDRLAVGSEGQLLTVVGGVPAYADAPVSTTLSAKADIQTHDGTQNATFSAGVDGQIMVYDSATLTGLNHRDYSPLTTKGSIYTFSTTEFEFLPGSDGQVVVYDSATTSGLNHKNYSPLTTKGDLYTFGTEESRLAVGGNGHFLMANDDAPNGVEWFEGLSLIDYDDNPVGTIIAYGSETVPGGYLLADGTCHSKTGDYSTLFGVIGTSAGECDSGTGAGSGFNVPDLRNQFLRGLTGGRTVFDTQADATAANGLSNSGVGNHTHTSYINYSSGGGGVQYNPGGVSAYSAIQTGGAGAHNHTISSTDAETRPQNKSVVYMIKAIGRKPVETITQKAKSPNKAGFIIWSSYDDVIEGHLKADGACVSKTDDSSKDYFQNVGTLYGECDFEGQGAGTGVNLPNLITDNRFIRAAGGALAVGQTQVDSTAKNGLTATSTSAGSHSHRINYSTSTAGGDYMNAGSTVNHAFGNFSDSSIAAAGDHSHPITIGAGDAETRPNAIALVPFVKMVNNDTIVGTFTNKLGDCKWSILDVADFNAQHEGDWVRLEGQSIAGTQLSDKYGINSFPDAVSNGAFIRQNGGNSGALRTFQDDKTAVNGLSTVTGGSHNHTGDVWFQDGGTIVNAFRAANNALGQYKGAAPTSTNGSHNHSLTGDNETAPKNISLNFFCMVNQG